MDSLQKCSWMTLGILVFLTEPGLGSSIIEGPSNLTALVGMEAHFNCTVSEGWQILIWLFEGQPVLSVIYPGKVIITDQSYNQQGYNKSTMFTSELKIYNVQLNNSGRIECSIQTMGDSPYAFLSVQVSGSLNIKDHNLTIRENQTIEIICEAVGWDPAPHITWMVNNISVDNSNYTTNWSQGSNGLYNEESILTLTPLANSTVICLAAISALSKPQSAVMTLVVYPPPKSNYQKEMRKVSMKKNATDQSLETRSDNGNENYGYSPEEQEHTKQIPRLPSFSPVDSSFNGLEQDLEVGSTSEISSQFSHSSQPLQFSSPVQPLYHFNQHSQNHSVHQSRRIPQQQSRIISSKIQKPTVHWQHKRKMNPKAKQSNSQYYYTRKVSFQKWQSSSQHTYANKPTHRRKQSETQEHQLHAHLVNRRQHKYPKMQQKKNQRPKSWAQLQHHKVQVSKGKQLHPSTKTKATKVRFLL